jgi:hypothetical protein
MTYNVGILQLALEDFNLTLKDLKIGKYLLKRITDTTIFLDLDERMSEQQLVISQAIILYSYRTKTVTFSDR